MAASRIPGQNGNPFDRPMTGRRASYLPGPIGMYPEPASAELDKEKREVILDLSQLILDITGIFEPTPFSDGTNALISLARGKWVDAAISAVSMIPYLGDLSKATKLPGHLDAIRRAIKIAKQDAGWSSKLRVLFVKLKKVLDDFSKHGADQLPDEAKKILKTMQQEIDRFLWPQGRTVHKAEVARPQIKRAGQKPANKQTTNPLNKEPVHNKPPERQKEASNKNKRLSPSQEKNLERFNKKKPANSTDTVIRDLPGGGKAFQADSAAQNIQNSFARFEKQIDSEGKTIQFTKTTFGPKGEIVHVKDKITGETFVPGR